MNTGQRTKTTYDPNKYVIGRCSICGGEVEQYRTLMIAGEWPKATCRQCGAVEKREAGIIIPMEPRVPSSNDGRDATNRVDLPKVQTIERAVDAGVRALHAKGATLMDWPSALVLIAIVALVAFGLWLLKES